MSDELPGPEIPSEGTTLESIYEGFADQGILVASQSRVMTLVDQDDDSHVALVLIMEDADDQPCAVAVFKPHELREHAHNLLEAVRKTEETSGKRAEPSSGSTVVPPIESDEQR